MQETLDLTEASSTLDAICFHISGVIPCLRYLDSVPERPENKLWGGHAVGITAQPGWRRILTRKLRLLRRYALRRSFASHETPSTSAKRRCSSASAAIVSSPGSFCTNGWTIRDSQLQCIAEEQRAPEPRLAASQQTVRAESAD